MKLIIIDRKAWERHRSEFADFIHSIEQLIGNPPEKDEWLDNEAVCKRLGISKRTLQSYRDTGKSLSQWLDTSVITRRATSRNYWTQTMNELWRRMKSLRRKTLRCSCFHNWWKEYWRNWSGIALPPVRCWAERFTSLARRFVANYGSVHARSKSTET